MFIYIIKLRNLKIKNNNYLIFMPIAFVKCSIWPNLFSLSLSCIADPFSIISGAWFKLVYFPFLRQDVAELKTLQFILLRIRKIFVLYLYKKYIFIRVRFCLHFFRLKFWIYWNIDQLLIFIIHILAVTTLLSHFYNYIINYF